MKWRHFWLFLQKSLCLMPKIHCLQHVHFESPGYLEQWARENHYPISFTRFYESFELPDLEDFHWLVVMGGPMSVHDDDQYSWLKIEKSFIRDAIEANKTVIGICLGCQLIAHVLGSSVYPNHKKEIGWFPVSCTESGTTSGILKGFPTGLVAFHWHGDTFELPQGAVHLMQTLNCKNQAFLYKDNVLGLQFHLEVQKENLQQMIANCKNELVLDDYVQSENDIIRNSAYIKDCNRYFKTLLDNLDKPEKT
jgi:GMP synthase-like glutamine amidotransferase